MKMKMKIVEKIKLIGGKLHLAFRIQEWGESSKVISYCWKNY